MEELKELIYGSDPRGSREARFTLLHVVTGSEVQIKIQIMLY